MTDKELAMYNIPFIQGMRGEWLDGDEYAFPDGQTAFVDLHGKNAWWLSKNIVWIPRDIDPRNPERGLVEMLTGTLVIARSNGRWFVNAGSGIEPDADNLIEALLHAIHKQQEEGK